MSTPVVTITGARPLTSELTSVAFTVEARRAKTSLDGHPLIGGGSVSYTHVGRALVGDRGAELLGAAPSPVGHDALCDAVFAAWRAYIVTRPMLRPAGER